jgi:hypothetical protein
LVLEGKQSMAAEGSFQEYADWFDQLCQTRWNDGAVEYGAMAFMKNDVMRMMVEELADTVNYCRAQVVKLMVLNDAVVSQNQELEDQEFRGTGEGWNS